ncbi:MAG TPA: hypothetical protein VHO69_15925 [Phototrophicaceae bacterium]|nr:hypothetical protein [Phototrophicaceae bacterium]
MTKVPVPPQLGHNLLIALENNPNCLNMINIIVAEIPRLQDRFFTLIHCCPTIYWEHGGGEVQEVRQTAGSVYAAEKKEFQATRDYFVQARAVLEAAGVSPSHIQIKTAVDQNSLREATVLELKQGQYSGVILAKCHASIASRVRGQSIMDIFRQIPRVTVWEIECC